ncbi:MAG TPA: serine--tRNA ligase [Ktedonobacteraceae bacterium]
MLSLDFIRQHPEVVSAGLKRRHDPQNIEELLRLLEQRRGLATRCEGLYVALKHLNGSIHGTPEPRREELNRQIKAVTKDIRLLELQIGNLETRMQPLLQSLPNVPHSSVQDGGEHNKNRVLSTWGEPLRFYFPQKTHWELSESLGLTDFEAGAKVAGSRFVVLKGLGARLERALISFMLDVHTREHGYTEIMPPFLVKRSLMIGAGQLPKFEDQAYLCSEDELYLNPTAEVPLVGLHSNSILPVGILPLRYTAWTSAFRREAGSAARQNRGLQRLHQFNKVELFQLVEPSDSYAALEQMVMHAEAILRQLELPYRLVELCASNLPFSSAKTLDLEVWMAGQHRYLEISSISNCEAFQARRADIKYRPAQTARAEYVHTLNASGLAVGRTMAAILEAYQQADGTIIVPKVLRPFMGVSVLKKG